MILKVKDLVIIIIMIVNYNIVSIFQNMDCNLIKEKLRLSLGPSDKRTDESIVTKTHSHLF